MKIHLDDTIAAVATPVGEGAIAVVRVSGRESIDIVDRIFRGNERLSESSGYTVHFGRLFDCHSHLIDEVLVTVFREPHSYTGENSVEISCHGGMYVTRRVMETIIDAGARQADPGEFTKRAFLNGKMDLSQAEAVADLIAARSEKALVASMQQLEGRLAGRVNELKSELLKLSSLIELELDFSEEGIDLISRSECLERIQDIGTKIQDMAKSFEVGKLYREGVAVAIIGKPNVGKSSLFNQLLSENRAIVTEIPGTTRDSIEECITLSGMLFRVSDTAGLRFTKDRVEAEGVTRTKRIIDAAEILLLVIDATGYEAGNVGFHSEVTASSPIIIVLNKIDLVSKKDLTAISADIPGKSIVAVSARTGEGIDNLRRVLVESVFDGLGAETSNGQITSKRHRDSLCRAADSISNARASLESGLSGEFLALDIKGAMDSLSEITGEVTTDDVLNSIFKSFCIGK